MVCECYYESFMGVCVCLHLDVDFAQAIKSLMWLLYRCVINVRRLLLGVHRGYRFHMCVL